jgi:hypothetical protein
MSQELIVLLIVLLTGGVGITAGLMFGLLTRSRSGS